MHAFSHSQCSKHLPTPIHDLRRSCLRSLTIQMIVTFQGWRGAYEGISKGINLSHENIHWSGGALSTSLITPLICIFCNKSKTRHKGPPSKGSLRSFYPRPGELAMGKYRAVPSAVKRPSPHETNPAHGIVSSRARTRHCCSDTCDGPYLCMPPKAAIALARNPKCTQHRRKHVRCLF